MPCLLYTVNETGLLSVTRSRPPTPPRGAPSYLRSKLLLQLRSVAVARHKDDLKGVARSLDRINLVLARSGVKRPLK